MMFHFHIFCVVICADGSYYKYSISSKGEAQRTGICKFLQMTDDWPGVLHLENNQNIIYCSPTFKKYIIILNIILQYVL